MSEPYLEVIYISNDDGEEYEQHVIDFSYFEWHSIVESLKMTHNYIRKQIILGEDYGWEESGKAPVNRVSPKTIQQARAIATHLRQYMAARHQGTDGVSAKYDPHLFNEDMPDA